MRAGLPGFAQQQGGAELLGSFSGRGLLDCSVNTLLFEIPIPPEFFLPDHYITGDYTIHGQSDGASSTALRMHFNRYQTIGAFIGSIGVTSAYDETGRLTAVYFSDTSVPLAAGIVQPQQSTLSAGGENDALNNRYSRAFYSNENGRPHALGIYAVGAINFSVYILAMSFWLIRPRPGQARRFSSQKSHGPHAVL